MKQKSIKIYHNSGEANTPWHVGLHDGTAITEQFGAFREPMDAVRKAIPLAAERGLPATKPAWLKVVLA